MASKQHAEKSMYMISATGLIPAMAAPTAAPASPASEIGVFLTLLQPNSVDNPFVTLNDPPKSSAMSSPIRNTFGSLLISSANASLIASLYVITRILFPPNTNYSITSLYTSSSADSGGSDLLLRPNSTEASTSLPTSTLISSSSASLNISFLIIVFLNLLIGSFSSLFQNLTSSSGLYTPGSPT